MKNDGNSAAAPERVWAEYQKGVEYKERIGLYERVRQNENFYIGNQWEGVNAPDLPKPTLNMLKRVVSYFTSMIVSDDIAVAFSPYLPDEQKERLGNVLSTEVERVIEEEKVKSRHREAVRNAAVDGDTCFYLWFDPDGETGQVAKGRIRVELVENTRVHFASPAVNEVERQEYIILSLRQPCAEVRREAEQNGSLDVDRIRPDSEAGRVDDEDDTLCTVLVKFFREEDGIHAVKCTQNATVKEEWLTGYTRYPVAWMNWERVRDSCHGASAVEGLRPNQIAVNKLFAMALRSVEMNAFPKILYDSTKIARWSSRVGEAIAVVGNPAETIVTGMRGSDMSSQVMQMIQSAISMTRDFMGASDAALGNVDPQNTSAIIAVQQASAMPLELQKLSFYQFVEDYVRIMVDLMRVHYGRRSVEVRSGGETTREMLDFDSVDPTQLRLRVDVGASNYWSELMQVQTMDNLFAKGILTDAEQYLESIPNRYVRNKQKLLDAIREQKEQAEEGAAALDGNGKEHSA